VTASCGRQRHDPIPSLRRLHHPPQR
jgi:hypothetical protein